MIMIILGKDKETALLWINIDSISKTCHVKEISSTLPTLPVKKISKIRSEAEKSLTENFLSGARLTMETPFPKDSGVAAKSLEEHCKYSVSWDKNLGVKLLCSVWQSVPFKSYHDQEKLVKKCCRSVAFFFFFFFVNALLTYYLLVQSPLSVVKT